MIALIIAQLILIGALLLYRIYMGDVPASISDSYYELNEKKQGFRHLFTFFCWAIAFLIVPIWLDVYGEPLEFLVFLACAGLLFAGTAAEFKSGRFDKRIHFFCAFLSAGASVIWLLFSGHWFVVLAMFVVAVFNIKISGKLILWLEVATIEAVIIGVFIQSLNVI